MLLKKYYEDFEVHEITLEGEEILPNFKQSIKLPEGKIPHLFANVTKVDLDTQNMINYIARFIGISKKRRKWSQNE